MGLEIKIRPVELADVNDLYEIHKGANNIAGTLQLPHTSLEFIRRRAENPPDGFYNLAAVCDEKVVGTLGLNTTSRPRRKHVGSIGMGVHDDYAGQGVGTALMAACIDMADNWLNLIRLELTVFHDNPAAIALYTKFDFVHEGRHVHYAFRNGSYVDSLAMARIRPGFVNDLSAN